jgi:hypothetical protein
MNITPISFTKYPRMSIVSPGCDSGKNTDYIWVYCMQCKCRRLVTLVSVVRLGAYCCDLVSNILFKHKEFITLVA